MERGAGGDMLPHRERNDVDGIIHLSMPDVSMPGEEKLAASSTVVLSKKIGTAQCFAMFSSSRTIRFPLDRLFFPTACVGWCPSCNAYNRQVLARWARAAQSRLEAQSLLVYLPTK